MLPPSCPITVASERRVPNPVALGGPETRGPPCSSQRMCTSVPSVVKEIRTRPSARESEPYFAAFVASSCRRSAMLAKAFPPTSTSGPTISMRSGRWGSVCGTKIVSNN